MNYVFVEMDDIVKLYYNRLSIILYFFTQKRHNSV